MRTIHFPIRKDNLFVGTLDKLASTIAMPQEQCEMTITVDKRVEPTYRLEIEKENEETFVAYKRIE